MPRSLEDRPLGEQSPHPTSMVQMGKLRLYRRTASQSVRSRLSPWDQGVLSSPSGVGATVSAPGFGWNMGSPPGSSVNPPTFPGCGSAPHQEH